VGRAEGSIIAQKSGGSRNDDVSTRDADVESTIAPPIDEVKPGEDPLDEKTIPPDYSLVERGHYSNVWPLVHVRGRKTEP
jgi:hypothetical protein